jgi:3-aminobutyryl-CoA ammonia-lyase
MTKVTHHLRLSQADAHYGGNLVDGARVLALFGDVATELLIIHDGDEGLFRAYQSVDFLHPLHAGDIIDVEGEITRVGTTSRDMTFTCHVTVKARPDVSDSAADVLEERILAVKATGTCIVAKDKQRKVRP